MKLIQGSRLSRQVEEVRLDTKCWSDDMRKTAGLPEIDIQDRIAAILQREFGVSPEVDIVTEKVIQIINEYLRCSK